MLLLSYIYIYFYYHYSYYGYNCLNRYLNNKPIDRAILNYHGYSFIGKRLCMLSHLVLIYSAYFLENPNFDDQLLFCLVSGFFERLSNMS